MFFHRDKMYTLYILQYAHFHLSLCTLCTQYYILILIDHYVQYTQYYILILIDHYVHYMYIFTSQHYYQCSLVAWVEGG